MFAVSHNSGTEVLSGPAKPSSDPGAPLKCQG